MRKWIFWIVLVVLVGGCSPWIGMHNIELGMSKTEVVHQMGKPSNVSGNSNEEYLWYTPTNRFWERYYVRLIGGKVESYGQLNKKEETPM